MKLKLLRENGFEKIVQNSTRRVRKTIPALAALCRKLRGKVRYELNFVFGCISIAHPDVNKYGGITFQTQ